MIKENNVCMRENPFYVDTVRMFRDRRYKYKGLLKVWNKKYASLVKQSKLMEAQDAKNLSILYNSLQLAHKVILNSFYGYVMLKGSRWYSMEMAAMVCHTGSQIILDSKKLVDEIGKPLELDTDGIWCLLPSGFPEFYTLTFKDGSKKNLEYPCSVLNKLTHDKFSNPQY